MKLVAWASWFFSLLLLTTSWWFAGDEVRELTSVVESVYSYRATQLQTTYSRSEWGPFPYCQVISCPVFVVRCRVSLVSNWHSSTLAVNLYKRERQFHTTFDACVFVPFLLSQIIKFGYLTILNVPERIGIHDKFSIFFVFLLLYCLIIVIKCVILYCISCKYALF